MTDIERLNKWLETQGKTVEGKIFYRLVWSNKIFENRYGLFRDFTESGLFLREVYETRNVRKYNYIHERWVLEKWAPGSLTFCRELPDTIGGDYIPVYVYEDRNGNYLAPTEKSLKFILDFMSGQVRKDRVLSQEEVDEKEIAHDVEAMDTHPMFATHGESRDSVAYVKEIKGKEY
jgi:hypothetical protein